MGVCLSALPPSFMRGVAERKRGRGEYVRLHTDSPRPSVRTGAPPSQARGARRLPWKLQFSLSTKSVLDGLTGQFIRFQNLFQGRVFDKGHLVHCGGNQTVDVIEADFVV